MKQPGLRVERNRKYGDNKFVSTKREHGNPLQSDPYTLHFAISLSQAEEPEMLLDTLLAGLVNVYSLQGARKIRLNDDSPALHCEQILGISSIENGAGDFEIQWDRVTQPANPDRELLNQVRSGEVVVEESNEGSTYWFPVTYKGNCRSMLGLTSSKPLDPDLANVRAILEIYTNLNHTLVQGQQDKLTGLLNRQTFDAKISRMLDKQSLKQKPSFGERNYERRTGESETHPWLVIVDIDHFKMVNDKYGHLYGDEVILTIGQLLRHCFRRSDLLFRFGGEEFVILLEPVPASSVEVALERFRQEVENHIFQQIGNVTVSAGYAKFVENSYPPMILDRADQALYYAKNNGRNQVANYEALVKHGKLVALERAEGSIDLF